MSDLKANLRLSWVYFSVENAIAHILCCEYERRITPKQTHEIKSTQTEVLGLRGGDAGVKCLFLTILLQRSSLLYMISESPGQINRTPQL